MNSDKNLSLKMGILYGAALGVVVVTIGVIRYRTGMILRGDQTLSYVYWVTFTATVFFGVFRFKKLAPLSFSFRQTMKIGLFAGLLSGTMYTIYIVILNNYIDTELSAKLVLLNEQQTAIESPELSKQEVSESLNPMKMSSAARGLVYTFVCMFFGIVHSLISTVIAKRLSVIKSRQT